jgi:hypothetical protein
MVFSDELKQDITSILSYGEQVRFKYYNQSLGAGSYYDDNVTYTQSGNDYWCSGLVCPIDSRLGGRDSLLLQQGKILYDDKKLYVTGDVQTSGLGPIKIGMTGSPTTQQYQIIEDGQVTSWGVNGTIIYKKIYIRYLTNGSFIGE